MVTPQRACPSGLEVCNLYGSKWQGHRMHSMQRSSVKHKFPAYIFCNNLGLFFFEISGNYNHRTTEYVITSDIVSHMKQHQEHALF